MTRKFALVVALLLTVVVMAMAIPNVNVSISKSSTIATVTTKLYRYSVDLQTGTMKNGYIVFERNKHFWEYGGDGFDLYASDTRLVPTGWSFKGGETSDFSTTANVSLTFFYNYDGNKIEKTITFVNGPNYEFQVSVKAPKNLKMELHFPTLESKFNETRNDIFGTFSSNSKNIGISVANGTFGKNGVLTFSGNVLGTTYFGPVKNSEIFALFPKRQGTITEIINTYPGSEPWYAWFLYLFVGILNWFYSWTGNYGWAIIIFGIVVRLVMYPLSHMQMKSMVQMRKVQPKAQALQKKYKDQKKAQEEVMKLYKEEGVNPASGCLLTFVQFPVLILLYTVIMYGKENFAYNPQFLFWKDLSVGGIGPNLILILLIILLMAWSTLWTSTSPKQVWQSVAISGVMEFLLAGFPVGLFLYYAVFSGMQVLTTYVVAKMYHIKGITLREVFGLNPKRRTYGG